MKKWLMITVISLVVLTACSGANNSQEGYDVTESASAEVEITAKAEIQITTEQMETTTEEVLRNDTYAGSSTGSTADSKVVAVPGSGLVFTFTDTTFVKNNHRIDLYLGVVNTGGTLESFSIADLSMQKGGDVPFDFTYSLWMTFYEDGTEELFTGYCTLAPGEGKAFRVGISDSDLRDITLSGFTLYYKNYKIKDL